MATNSLLSSMEEMASERDRQEFALGDTLDIKTGLIMAALTFLAIQSGELIHTGVAGHARMLQYLAVLALVVGGVCTTLVLYPREYLRQADPLEYQRWIAAMEEHRREHPESPELTVEQFAQVRIDSAVTNIQANEAINRQKARYMFTAFFCSVAAFGLNLVTLAIRLF